MSYDSSVESPASSLEHQKQSNKRRMRTSFKQHELRLMHTYFTVNRNPNRRDLEQLSEKTGLETRVLQVRYCLT